MPKNYRFRFAFRVFASLTALAIWAPPAHAFDLVLNVSPSFGQLVGDRVTLEAEATNIGSAVLRYQFSVRAAGENWRIVRDFDEGEELSGGEGVSSIEWATLDEGTYELRAVAVDPTTDERQEATAFIGMTTRITDGNPVVNATKNPLVAIYSAPPCTSFGRVRVRFGPQPGGENNESQSGGNWTVTPTKTCEAGKSVNFYVAGLRADTLYVMRNEGIVDGQHAVGRFLPFRTGQFEIPFADDIRIADAADHQGGLTEPVLLLNYLAKKSNAGNKRPVATDLAGNVIWFYDPSIANSGDPYLMLRPVAGGTMLFMLGDEISFLDRLVEFDLAGNTVRETNIARLNEQLAAIGEQPGGSFSHDAIRLPNDHTAVLTYVDRVLTDVQGPGDVDVLGDAIYVLDENFQLVWAWNPFDHLDPTETAVLGETCVGGQSCAIKLLRETANDWTHANALDYTPEDGNLVISMRNLDAVFKIDYADGTGTGNVVWRLGKDGDFRWPTDDIWPWFSHQHYAHFEDGLFVVYDNGNTRIFGMGGGNSRAQVLRLDETNLQVQILANTDLGDFSGAGGSAELLQNGNLSFDSGFLDSDDYPFLPANDTAALIQEILPDGKSTFVFGSTGYIYRSWRMKSLYEPSS